MEGRFHEILDKYKLGCDAEEIELFWLQAIRDAINNSWNLHRNAVAKSNAWAMRALVKADELVRKKLIEVTREINEIKNSLKMEEK